MLSPFRELMAKWATNQAYGRKLTDQDISKPERETCKKIEKSGRQGKKKK